MQPTTMFCFWWQKKGWKCNIQFYRTHLSGLITYSLNYERNKEIRNDGKTKVVMVKCKLRDNRLLISSVDRNPISISSSLDLDWHIPFLGSLFPENIQKCFRIIMLYYHNKIQNTFCHSDIIPFVFFGGRLVERVYQMPDCGWKTKHDLVGRWKERLSQSPAISP